MEAPGQLPSLPRPLNPALDGHGLGPSTATDEKKKSLFYFGCDFSGWYNFGKIIKIVITRCHVLKLKCTKFDFGCPRPRSS